MYKKFLQNTALPFLLCFVSFFAQGQNFTYKGRITDTTGNPIFGASVTAMDDAKIGIVTDEKGYYKLITNKPIDSLEFSAVGYKNIYTHTLSNISTIQLYPETLTLSEIVINSAGCCRISRILLCWDSWRISKIVKDSVVENKAKNSILASQVHSLFPNPARNNTILRADFEIKSIILFDASGKNTRLAIQKVNNKEYSIDVSLIPSGTYFLRYFSANGQSGTDKLIVAH